MKEAWASLMDSARHLDRRSFNQHGLVTASLQLNLLLLCDLQDLLVDLLVVAYHLLTLFYLIDEFILLVLLFDLGASHICESFLHLPMLVGYLLELLSFPIDASVQLAQYLLTLKRKLCLRQHEVCLSVSLLLDESVYFVIYELELLP